MGANKLKTYTTSYCHFFRQQTKLCIGFRRRRRSKERQSSVAELLSSLVSYHSSGQIDRQTAGMAPGRCRCLVADVWSPAQKKKIVCSALFFKNLNSNKPNTPRSFWETNFHYSPHRCLLQIATSNGHVWSGEIWRELYSNILLFTVDFLCWKEISEEIFSKISQIGEICIHWYRWPKGPPRAQHAKHGPPTIGPTADRHVGPCRPWLASAEHAH